MVQNRSILFVGAGQMATAISVGMLKSELFPASQIMAVDPDENARLRFSRNVPDARIFPAWSHVDSQPDWTVLAVKPQMLEAACDSGRLSANQNVLSVVAGVSIRQLVTLTGTGRVARAMPNTPAFVNLAATAICYSPEMPAGECEFARRMMESVGIVVPVEERLMNAVTGLSGSGPAWVFRFVESMIDGGVAAGLPRDTARTLALQTILGAVQMTIQRGEHPRVLSDQVTSPGGTTAAGLRSLEENRFSHAVVSAILAAVSRAGELGEWTAGKSGKPAKES